MVPRIFLLGENGRETYTRQERKNTDVGARKQNPKSESTLYLWGRAGKISAYEKEVGGGTAATLRNSGFDLGGLGGRSDGLPARGGKNQRCLMPGTETACLHAGADHCLCAWSGR